jgi:tRNA(Ser,Leu) C12 N-acetylase TAN1
MQWNVVISVQEHGFNSVRGFLSDYGEIQPTEYFNLLAMRVENVDDFLEDMRANYVLQVQILEHVGRIIPVTHGFMFQSPEEFEKRAKTTVDQWLGDLSGRHFFVRMHRRGFKGRLSSQDEERFLDGYILAQLENEAKLPAKIDFEHAERIIAIETLGQQAGLSYWTREQLERYPFLKLK